ncbi:hypothetical protein OIV83_005098 [Microbotryomycetes sp. JL201]|nr:hypothetical protein OIV83_005098 [Microbotryomycetes sp. JL201]
MVGSKQAIPPPPPHAPLVQSNNNSLYYVKASSACLAGSLSGTLALPSLHGFALYFISSLITSTLFVLLKMSNSSTKRPVYFQNGVRDVVLTGVGENLLAFVLFWTFFYSVVHVYD